MTCITYKLEDVPCIFCKRADQVYVGHGIVRFCAHCTISWDPSEDGTLLSKSIIFSDSATDGELPEDIVSRMGLLSGNVLSALNFEGRLREVLALPEDIFLKHNRLGNHPMGSAVTWGSSINKLDIVERRPMGDGRKNPELVMFEDGSEGIFKKWDDDSAGEILAYEFSEELGFNHIPPTARYERGGEVGTVQKFTDSEGTGQTVSHDKRNLSGQEMAAMDYIQANSDRRDPNFLVNKDGSFVAIDNGNAFSVSLIEPHTEATGFVGANAGRKMDPGVLRNVRMADVDLIVSRMEKADILSGNAFMEAMAKVAKAAGFDTPAEYLGNNLKRRIAEIIDFGGVPPFLEG